MVAHGCLVCRFSDWLWIVHLNYCVSTKRTDIINSIKTKVKKPSTIFRNKRYVYIWLLCMWFLCFPFGQRLSLTDDETSSISVPASPMASISTLNFYGYGYHAIYLTCWQIDQELHTTNKVKQSIKGRRKGDVLKVLFFLLLLSGDIQLNPGPSTWVCLLICGLKGVCSGHTCC